MKKTCLLFALSLFILNVCKAQFQLVRSASQGATPNCFNLTPDLTSQAGAVWYTDSVDISKDFDIYAQIYLGTRNSGADGMAFVLQQVSTNVGISGGGLGYRGLTPSLALEFDTYRNGAELDPTYDHAALMANGSVRHSGANQLVPPRRILAGTNNAEDGRYHDLHISWNAQTQTFTAYVDCDLLLTYTGDIVNNIFRGNPKVFWGFTAATGAARNAHRFCLDYVSFIEELRDTTLCGPGTVQLNAGSGSGNVFSWTPTQGLNNPNIPNPVASVDTTTTYVVTVTDNCGKTRIDSLTITVGTPLLADAGADTSICLNESVQLFGNGGLTYQWTPAIGLSDSSISNPVATPNITTTYTLTISDDVGCTATDEVIIQVNNLPQAEAGTDESICIGDNIALSATGGTIYQWTPALDLSDANSASPTASPQATTQYIVEVTDNNGCQDTDTVNVLVNPLPHIVTGQDETICEGTDLSLTASGGTSYNWSPATDISDPSSPTPTINPSKTTLYTVIGTDINGCTDTDSILVQVTPRPLMEGRGLYEICTGDAVNLSVSGAASYLWSNGAIENNIDVIPPSDETFWVIPVENGCEGDTFNIRVLVDETLPSLLAEASDSLGVAPFDISFFNNSKNAVEYLWNFGDGQTSTELYPTHTYASPGTYTVRLTGTNANGCEVTSDVLSIEVRPNIPVIPNAFTPNGDGINDQLSLRIQNLTDFHFAIFSRWGRVVFETTDPAQAWDGTYKGKIMPEGVYVYSLNGILNGQERIRYSGSITLLR